MRKGLTMRCRVTGGKEIQRMLTMLPAEIAAGPMRDAVAVGGDILKQHAVANAEAIRITGTLAGSIESEMSEHGLVGTRVTVKVGPTGKGWYGRLVERGHKIANSDGEVPPHPWLRPALDDHRAEVSKAVADELERRLRQWFK